MKLSFGKFGARARLAAVALSLGSLCLGQSAQAQFATPIGTWDFVMSGSRDGVAYITFSNDFTFGGYEIIVPKHSNSGLFLEARNNGTDDSRQGSGTGASSGSTPPGTNIFGFEPVKGPWGFDVKGRVIGSFIETLVGTCTTNVVVTSTTVTNGDTTVTTFSTNVTINCTGLTNALSFVGKVTPGKRFTMTASTAFGKVTYRGVPFTALPDLSGNWYGSATHGQQVNTEFFTFSASALGANIYDVLGNGPGYPLDGVAIASSQKKIGFAITTDPTNDVVRATIGSLNATKGTARTKGVEQGSGSITNFIRFDATKQPVTPGL